jgi:hypothetical protein
VEKLETGSSPDDPLGVALKKLVKRVKRRYAVHRLRWDCQHEPMEMSLRRVDPTLTAHFGLTVRRLKVMLPKYRVTFDVPDGWFNIQVILRSDIRSCFKLRSRFSQETQTRLQA